MKGNLNIGRFCYDNNYNVDEMKYEYELIKNNCVHESDPEKRIRMCDSIFRQRFKRTSEQIDNSKMRDLMRELIEQISLLNERMK